MGNGKRYEIGVCLVICTALFWGQDYLYRQPAIPDDFLDVIESG